MSLFKTVKASDVKIGARFLIADGSLESVTVATVTDITTREYFGQPKLVFALSTPREREIPCEYEDSLMYDPSHDIEILDFYGVTECDPATVYTL